MIALLARAVVMLVALECVIVSVAGAQYDLDREYSPRSDRFLNLGFVQRNFRPRPSNTGPDSLAIRYERFMPMIGFRQGMVDASFGFTSYRLQGRSRSTIFFGVSVANEFRLSRGKCGATLSIPLTISADYTKAEGLGPNSDGFNVASVGLGAGLRLQYHASGVSFWVQAIEAAHFSTEGFGAANGFSAATIGEAALFLRRAALLDGLVMGYRFRFQTWSLSESRFNYRSLSHGPFLGVLF